MTGTLSDLGGQFLGELLVALEATSKDRLLSCCWSGSMTGSWRGLHGALLTRGLLLAARSRTCDPPSSAGTDGDLLVFCTDWFVF